MKLAPDSLTNWRSTSVRVPDEGLCRKDKSMAVDRIFPQPIDRSHGHTTARDLTSDKLSTADTASSRMGLVEPGPLIATHARMSLAQQCWVRDDDQRFWKAPVQRASAPWGPHAARFLLLTSVEPRLQDVLQESVAEGYEFKDEWLRRNLNSLSFDRSVRRVASPSSCVTPWNPGTCR